MRLGNGSRALPLLAALLPKGLLEIDVDEAVRLAHSRG